MVKRFSLTLTGTTTPDYSNSNEEVPHIDLSFRTEASSADGLISYPGHSLGRVFPLRKDTVSRLGFLRAIRPL